MADKYSLDSCDDNQVFFARKLKKNIVQQSLLYIRTLMNNCYRNSYENLSKMEFQVNDLNVLAQSLSKISRECKTYDELYGDILGWITSLNDIRSYRYVKANHLTQEFGFDYYGGRIYINISGDQDEEILTVLHCDKEGFECSMINEFECKNLRGNSISFGFSGEEVSVDLSNCSNHREVSFRLIWISSYLTKWCVEGGRSFLNGIFLNDLKIECQSNKSSHFLGIMPVESVNRGDSIIERLSDREADYVLYDSSSYEGCLACQVLVVILGNGVVLNRVISNRIIDFVLAGGTAFTWSPSSGILKSWHNSRKWDSDKGVKCSVTQSIVSSVMFHGYDLVDFIFSFIAPRKKFRELEGCSDNWSSDGLSRLDYHERASEIIDSSIRYMSIDECVQRSFCLCKSPPSIDGNLVSFSDLEICWMGEERPAVSSVAVAGDVFEVFLNYFNRPKLSIGLYEVVHVQRRVLTFNIESVEGKALCMMDRIINESDGLKMFTIVKPPSQFSPIKKRLGVIKNDKIKSLPYSLFGQLIGVRSAYTDCSLFEPVLCNSLIGSDRSQKRMVDQALNDEGVTVGWGPVGTGKSTAAAEVIYQYAKEAERNCGVVLVVAKTNAAVDALTEKFIKHYVDGCALTRFNGRLMRIGSKEKTSKKLEAYFSNNSKVSRKNRQEGCVVSATIDSLITSGMSVPKDFPVWLVFDEFGVVSLAESLSVMSFVNEKAFLIGDPRQLGLFENKQSFSLLNSLSGIEFPLYSKDERLVFMSHFKLIESTRYWSVCRLSRVYRLNETITELTNYHYQDSDYSSLTSVVNMGLVDYKGDNTVVLVDSSNDGNGQEYLKDKNLNDSHLDFLVSVVLHLSESVTYHQDNVAIIIPYKKQIRELKRRLSSGFPDGESSIYLENFDDMVNTVYPFQGGERYITIVDLVRQSSTASADSSTGYISIEMLLVMMTRSLKGPLCVIADMNLMKASKDKSVSDFMTYFEGFVNGNSSCSRMNLSEVKIEDMVGPWVDWIESVRVS
ncbi:AAA domain-containing protein [Gilvimarinus sp. SDUM040013]|uniref:AAA domain-containing protein n=1 Tax=Gilvimarinus gilvus TaxID=3058038 RepID=A0ABU4RX74_9GAMM|nr:AAA domain-containing protein [Gilvimarinus sp. SDUM040013]MDO3386621.1 AAA domain-containing protein [Gilvimarinus sp. SDUM040013]MDX6849492.1 AAA domain-containing protein [Gilvimarinus sp. SDUM040013]